MVDFVLFEMYAFDKHLFLRYNVLFLLVCVCFFNVETVYHSFKNIFWHFTFLLLGVQFGQLKPGQDKSQLDFVYSTAISLELLKNKWLMRSSWILHAVKCSKKI